MALSLPACTGKEDKPAAGGAIQPAATARQTPQADQQAAGIHPPTGVQLPDSKRPSHDYSALPSENQQTITVVSPNANKLSPDDRVRLEQERQTIEAAMGDIVKQYDKNLDNPQKRQLLEAKMREQSAEYKEKVLSLVKDKLKEEKP